MKTHTKHPMNDAQAPHNRSFIFSRGGAVTSSAWTPRAGPEMIANQSHTEPWDHALWPRLFQWVRSHYRHHACVVAPLPLWQRHVARTCARVLRPEWSSVVTLFDLDAPPAWVPDQALLLPADTFTAFDDPDRAAAGLRHGAGGGGAWARLDVEALTWAHRAHRALPAPIPSHSIQWGDTWTGTPCVSYGCLARQVARLAGGAVRYGPELAVQVGESTRKTAVALAPAVARALGFIFVPPCAPRWRLRLGAVPIPHNDEISVVISPPLVSTLPASPAAEDSEIKSLALALAPAAPAAFPAVRGRTSARLLAAEGAARQRARWQRALADARGDGGSAEKVREARRELRGLARDGGLLHHLSFFVAGASAAGGGGAPPPVLALACTFLDDVMLPAWWDHRYPSDTEVRCAGPAHHPPLNASAPWRALPHVLYDMVRSPLPNWSRTLCTPLHVLLGLYAEHVDTKDVARQTLTGLARAMLAAPGVDCEDMDMWLTAEERSRPWADLCPCAQPLQAAECRVRLRGLLRPLLQALRRRRAAWLVRAQARGTGPACGGGGGPAWRWCSRPGHCRIQR